VLCLFFLCTSIRISLVLPVVAFGLDIYSFVSQATSPNLFELVWLFLPPLIVAYVFSRQPSHMASQAITNEQLAAVVP
jgi:hypothetical protein